MLAEVGADAGGGEARRVHAHDGAGRAVPEPLLVAIDIAGIALTA